MSSQSLKGFKIQVSNLESGNDRKGTSFFNISPCLRIFWKEDYIEGGLNLEKRFIIFV